MKQSQASVRQATIFDLDLIVPLFDAYRQFYRAGAAQSERRAPLARRQAGGLSHNSDLALARRFLRERFEHHQSIIFLALLADGSAAGFTQLYPSFSSLSAARILILNDLFVLPEARRAKVGSLLLGAAVNYGREVGAVRLTLSTEVSNVAAQALYEAEGWQRETNFYAYNFALGQRTTDDR